MNTVNKFRKKPVVIEAFHYTGINDAFALGEWAKERGVFYWDDNNVLHVKTLEGEHIASDGDFIIKGIAGEFYPCKPDIFEKTYEPASQSEQGYSEAEVKELLGKATIYSRPLTDFLLPDQTERLADFLASSLNQ
jgi:hypothetical protein